MTIKSPLDHTIGNLTLNSFTEFRVPPYWGYFLDTTLTPTGQFPPINLNLVPLYGASVSSLKFLVKDASISPRQITYNKETRPFLRDIPPSYTISINNRLFFFTRTTTLLYRANIFNICTTKKYRFPIVFDASTKDLSYLVLTPAQTPIFASRVVTIIDDNPPTLDSLEIMVLNQTHSVVRLGASDDVSGVFMIDINNLLSETPVTKYHLVSGTKLNGVYEIIVPWKKSWPAQIQVYDYAGLSKFYANEQLNLMFDLDLQQSKSYHIGDITSLYLSKNQVDVTLSGVDVVLYANLSQTQQQRDLYSSIALTVALTKSTTLVLGVYNERSQLYEFPFKVPAKTLPAQVRYFLTINMQPFSVESDLLIGKFGAQARLNVINTGVIDTTFPIVTKVDQVPGQDQPLVWDLEFYDVSGVKKVIIGISSEYDFKGKNITLDGGGQTTFRYNLTYELDPSTCRAMNYWISYVYTEDLLGNIGESVRYSNIDFHPFYKFDDSTFDIISVGSSYCSLNIAEISSPVIKSLAYTRTTNSSIQNEQVQIFFKVTDDTKISLDHLPVCFFTDSNNDLVSSVARIVNNGNSGAIVDYICDFIFPFAYGPRALLSIYGLSDIYFNYIGFPSNDLRTLTFNPVYSIPDTSSLVVIESTSSLETSSDVLYIYGRGFKIGSTIVTIQADLEKFIEVPTITTGSVLVLNNLKPAIEYKIRVTEETSRESSLVVTLKGQLPTTPSPTPVTPTPTPTSPSCKTDCGASLGYGEYCSSTIANTTIEPNPHIPSVNLTLDGENGGTTNTKSKFSSLIQLISLKELENGGNDVVSKHVFNNNQWINVPSESNDPNVKTSKYKYIINNSLNTTIYSTVQVFPQAKSITFGKQQLQMNPSTVKFTFNITSYPFSKSTNTLQFIMAASILSSEQIGCSYQEFIQDDNNSQYLKIQIDQVSLFGRFIGYGIIDGREESITNSVVNQADEIATQQTSNSQQSYIGLNIRYFQQTALLDPDFSVLIETKSASDQDNSICSSARSSKKLSVAQIAGIVIGGVVFLFILCAVIVYVLSKKSSNPIALKLRRLAKN
ncbi:hypothetical protein CYY_004515 [Polysphondylium violaceum]|uniref:IPT/TIG domain-containing protein n=1 Tax=Polysphondylium violaceum TaxID=133409 RepID=A0A8J4PV58_9MYCE|nr:hypothetical protein CYY_004515 [Polysphondylium violaceum]